MTTPTLKAAFEFEGITVRLDNLLPSRPFSEKEKDSMKYRSLLASIQEVGIVEPISVFPQKGGKFLILDGHARIEALRERGIAEARCLVASQDESYTYNKKVNRVPPIQANKMILKALDAGVPEERIARALNISVSTVRGHRSMLKDICPEAVQTLQDKQIAQETIAVFKRVKPIRQIEMAEMMVGAGTYSATYARALMMTTPKEHLVNPDSFNRLPGVKPEDMARIEHEVRIQEKDFRMLDETYNEQVLALTLARGWLRPLLENGRIVRFLSQHFREYLEEFNRILESGSLAR
jgi:ParB-like chromosome segregation protein Spo0J